MNTEALLPAKALPLHVVTLLLQFAVPEIMSIGEARLLCRGTAAALASPSFWRGIAVSLSRDEGSEPAPKALESSRGRYRHSAGTAVVAGSSSTSSASSSSFYSSSLPVGGGAAIRRGTATSATKRPWSNADCIRNSSGSSNSSSSSSSSRPVGRHKQHFQASAGSDHIRRVVAGPVAPGAASGRRGAGQSIAWGAAARTFLRRYHHHVAFRRLTPPVAHSETVKMPVAPMYPTCLHACGCMVAVGTREGPVLLFDVGPQLPCEAAAAGIRSASTVSSASIGGGGGGSSSGGKGGDSCEGAASVTRVYRVYGSLADGTGPASSVLLDRAKVIAAGCGSRRSGGGYVIRCAGVD
ncbi:unnamed protein product, partial [Hapterophycus canaliculatus]